MSRQFDPPQTRYGAGHRGADLAGRVGQVVRAAGAGRISYAGLLAGRGVLVVVHGDLRTTYEPVAASVRVGQQVQAGQAVGRLEAGHPGCPGACLHWGLRRGDTYLDPVRLLKPGRSRLLPLDDVIPAAHGTAPAARSGAIPAAQAPQRAAPALPATPELPPADPRPAADPAFALRAADAAWGSGALVALVAGLALLLRPRRPPDGPAAPALAAGPLTGPQTAPATALVGASGDLVDLASERNRRRPDVA